MDREGRRRLLWWRDSRWVRWSDFERTDCRGGAEGIGGDDAKRKIVSNLKLVVGDYAIHARVVLIGILRWSRCTGPSAPMNRSLRMTNVRSGFEWSKSQKNFCAEGDALPGLFFAGERARVMMAVHSAKFDERLRRSFAPLREATLSE